MKLRYMFAVIFIAVRSPKKIVFPDQICIDNVLIDCFVLGFRFLLVEYVSCLTYVFAILLKDI